MIRNYNIHCYNDFNLITDVFCKKSNLGKAYINAATIYMYKIFFISVINKLKNTDFTENIEFNIKDIEDKGHFFNWEN